MNQWLCAWVVVVLVGCSSGTGATGGGAGGGTGGGAGGGAGGGTGGGSGGGVAGGSGGGGGGAVDAGIPIPTPLIGLSAGADVTCAVLANKTARCWGRNNEGQLGDGTLIDSIKPVVVSGLSTVKSISAGYEHSCAVLEDGTARCWGRNVNGQLGNNTTVDSEVPVPVTGLTSVVQIEAGVSTSCARTSVAADGGSGSAVYCWGRGGELGDGTVTQSNLPRVVPGLTDVTQLSLSSNAGTSTTIHVCGVRSTGAAFCWGSNSAGELGDGTQNPSRVPVTVSGINDALEITAGGSHACARRTSGLSCWGFGQQIGDGTTMQRLLPTAVTTSVAVNSISAGAGHTLARTSTDGLICWGRNSRGQCGDSAAFTASGPINLVPVASTLTGVSLVSSGNYHACGYVAATSLTWCWGANDWGELGYGTPGQPSRISVPDFVRW